MLSEGDYTEEEYARLVKKIDRYLLPLMIQQSDKTSLGTQALFGMREQTGLVGQQYSWLTTIFYLTYLFSEFPSNFIMQRYPLGKTLATYMIIWGVIVGCVSACHNFTELMVVRGLQGVFESSISPGFLLVIGAWYQTREHPSRSLFFQSANAGYGVIVDLCMYGIGSKAAKNPDGFPAWRAIGLFLGGSTVLAAGVCFVFLGTPKEVWWLTEEEKRMASARIVRNKTGSDRVQGQKFKMEQAREALRDPVTWFSFLNVFIASIPNGGITTFGSVIIQSLGFDSLQVILLGIPRSVLSVIWFTIAGVVTSRVPNVRFFFMMASVVPCFIGMLVMGLLPLTPATKWTKYETFSILSLRSTRRPVPDPPPFPSPSLDLLPLPSLLVSPSSTLSRWGGLVLSVPAALSVFMAWSFLSSNVAGKTKKTVVSSITFIGYCAGNMIGAQVFQAKDAPQYLSGLIVCAAAFCAQFFVIVAWRQWYVRKNRIRNEAAIASGVSEEERERMGRELGELDTTDGNNPHFRYTL
ncbi:MFS general substrate transporter [Mrakia frigida]|uniref:MFS general substrate transporter n=1 Tax=Mrakia frigida TaxID=29902 RepID=UPI003FCC2297